MQPLIKKLKEVDNMAANTSIFPKRKMRELLGEVIVELETLSQQKPYEPLRKKVAGRLDELTKEHEEAKKALAKGHILPDPYVEMTIYLDFLSLIDSFKS